jgi:hypothetical protein
MRKEKKGMTQHTQHNDKNNFKIGGTLNPRKYTKQQVKTKQKQKLAETYVIWGTRYNIVGLNLSTPT